jgi:RNA 2',3'-cyclic 3'-phosphodiesterase
MRLFVAVEIDDHARHVAEMTADALRRAIGPALKARWVPPENMHLTVRFIGPVDDERAPAIVDALSAPLAMPPFEIGLGACGVFPPSGAPRVVWIGLTAGFPELSALHDEFDRRLVPFGFESETRPFSAHLTLARVKDPSTKLRAGAPKGLGVAVQQAVRRVAPTPARCRITRATIFQSHVSSQGARYEPIASAPLMSARC